MIHESERDYEDYDTGVDYGSSLIEKIAAAKSLLTQCDERENRFLKAAMEASRADDAENVWYAMASRAENNRLSEKLRAFLKENEPEAIEEK